MGRDKRKLDKESPEPLYKQLFCILREELQALPADSKFHSERWLCERFGVSQAIVRMSLSMLEKEGLILRLPSKGTFVREKEQGRPSIDGKMRIGVIFPMNYPPRQSEIFDGISAVAHRTGHEILLIQDKSISRPDKNLMAVRLKQHIGDVDGIIWMSSIMNEMDSLPKIFAENSARIVFSNLIISERKHTSVVADYGSAVSLLAKKLIQPSGGEIGFIGGNEGRLASRMRYKGFLRGMNESGVETNPAYVFPYGSDFSYETGYSGADRMIKGGVVPRVIITCSDYMAIGAIYALRQHGYRVPEDVGVTGFDNLGVCVQIRPNITSIGQPGYQIGKLAARILISQVEGEADAGSLCYVQCPVFMRESTGKDQAEMPEEA